MSLNTNYSSPMAYHTSKVGAVHQWRCWTVGNEIFTEHGQVGGQLQTTPGKKCEAKNVGRANATTPEEQAVLEAQAMFKFKMDRKYCLSIEESKARKQSEISPMLAPTDGFLDSVDGKGKLKKGTKRYVTYPCDVQPKLDGVRCLAYWKDERIVLLSRGLKEWDLPHLVEQLEKLLPKDAMFDGELYVHGMTFQQVTKLVKGKPHDKAKVQYYVYDVPVCGDEEKTWIERRADLERLVPTDNPVVYRVLTATVSSEEEVMEFQAVCLEQGFEGAMIRLHHGIYEWGVRSKYLLKVKTFDDTEFVVVGFTNGKGKNETTVKWICQLADGRTFDCAPMGSVAEREKMFQHGEKYVGKKLTVKHFGYTDEGKPRFPVGKGFRPDEDLAA